MVEVFLGVASRYSYLASTQIEALEADTGCKVIWRPLFSADLMALRGDPPFKGEPVSGQYDWSYRQYDAECWAAYYGVPFREPPAYLIHDYDVLRRLALAATAAARLDAAAPYCRQIFRAVFDKHPDRIDDELLQSFAAASRCNVEAFRTAIGDPATAARLRDTTREAHERGAFGVPSFFVDDRIYWGNDRLVLLRHHLAQRSSA